LTQVHARHSTSSRETAERPAVRQEGTPPLGPAGVLALQRRIGNRAVGRLIRRNSFGSSSLRRTHRSLQRWPATITSKHAQLRTEFTSRENGTGTIERQRSDLRLPKGTKVEIDYDNTLRDDSGAEYTWITYTPKGENAKSGYINSRYVRLDVEPPKSQGAAKPHRGLKLGFELEFPHVYVVPYPIKGKSSQRLVASATQAGATIKTIRDTAEEGVGEAPFPKRTVLFRPPNRTWAATTDTTHPGVSNLEIVGAPLTPNQLDSEQVDADRRTLDRIFKTLVAKGHPLVTTPGLLSAELDIELVDVRENIVFINGSSLAAGDWHAQFTQATKLAHDEPLPSERTWWLGDLDFDALGILTPLVNVMKTPKSALTKKDPETGKVVKKYANPKNLFATYLPKTPVAKMLGTTAEPDKAKRDAWTSGMAAKYGVDPKAFVGEELVSFYDGLLNETNLTWKEFFDDLLKGTDRVAQWSRTAFTHDAGGVPEDFGYGTIYDKTLPEKWYVREDRAAGKLNPQGVWTYQREWARKTRESLESS
jgi:hypothetical protein